MQALRGKFLFFVFAFLFLGSLAACSLADKVSPQEEFQKQQALYMQTLRWKDCPNMAAFFTEPRREHFFDQTLGLDDLRITDVRLLRSTFQEETAQVKTIVEVDYYLLPSLTVKTLRMNQDWTFYPGDNFNSGVWQITSPFQGFGEVVQ